MSKVLLEINTLIVPILYGPKSSLVKIGFVLGVPKVLREGVKLGKRFYRGITKKSRKKSRGFRFWSSEDGLGMTWALQG